MSLARDITVGIVKLDLAEILYIFTVLFLTVTLLPLVMTQSTILDQLLTRRDTWRGRIQLTDSHTSVTGNDALDQLLCGGWPSAALTELLITHEGMGELSLLIPTLKNHAEQQRSVVWLNPPYRPYAPTLVHAGLPLQQLLIVQSRHHCEWLWCAEQAMRHNALLLAWPLNRPGYTDLRKLQLASAESDCPHFLFLSANARASASPSSLRLVLDRSGEQSAEPKLRITIHKLRGVAPGASIEITTPGIAFCQTLNQ